MCCLFYAGGLVTTNGGEAVTLAHIMLFFSASSGEPLLGFRDKPTLTFGEGSLATAGTCGLKLKIPIVHGSYPLFSNYMTLSVMGHGGFGQV